MKDPLVSICCITYNQAPYVRQCLDGFLMQKCSFDFEVIIHDDASTDGTEEIIKEYEKKYPNVIKPIYEKENQYSQGVRAILATFCYPKAVGKYIAICEGDDYWIDPYKLQKQVDFLESHPDYGMVHTKADLFYQTDKKLIRAVYGDDFDSFDQLLVQNCISTLTVCARREFFLDYSKEVERDSSWMMGDYPLWLYIAMKSKVYRLNESTAVYRCLDNSASHSKNFDKQIQFILSVFSVQYYFMKKTHKEYLHRKIVQKRFDEIINLHIDYKQKLNISMYKRKFHIKSLGFVYTLKTYLRMFKYRICGI